MIKIILDSKFKYIRTDKVIKKNYSLSKLYKEVEKAFGKIVD